LLDALVAILPTSEEAEEDESIKIAIVGKPNVGKSSLLNRLLEKNAPSLADPGHYTRCGGFFPGIRRYSDHIN